MKKIIIALVICMSFAFGVVADDVYREFTAKEVDYTIQKDNVVQNYTLPIVSIDDRTYVPIRELCENMNYTVDWNEEQKLIALSEKIEDLPEIDNINSEKNGVLMGGTQYTYVPDEKFSYVEQSEFKSLYHLEKGIISSPQIAAEYANLILKAGDDEIVFVSYDREEDVWVVSARLKESKPFHSGRPEIIIRRSDGKVLGIFYSR